MAKRKGRPSKRAKKKTTKKIKELQLDAMFVDGETLNSDVVQHRLKMKTVTALKRFIDDQDIPYARVGGHWWIESTDIRKAMNRMKQTHSEHQAEREAKAERKPDRR